MIKYSALHWLGLQTKDTLTLRASAFGSKCELPEKFLKKVADAGVLEAVSQFAKYKEDRALKKSDGAKRNRLTGGCRFGCISYWLC